MIVARRPGEKCWCKSNLLAPDLNVPVTQKWSSVLIRQRVQVQVLSGTPIRVYHTELLPQRRVIGSMGVRVSLPVPFIFNKEQMRLYFVFD